MPFDPNSHFWGVLLTLAVIVQTVVQNYYARRAQADLKAAAHKAEEVKAALGMQNAVAADCHEQSLARLEEIRSTTESTRTLVNGRTAAALAALAAVARRLADLTCDPSDLAAAAAAEKASAEHEAVEREAATWHVRAVPGGGP